MRTTQTMTISLPPALVVQFDAVRKVESRTRSELVREAFRVYFESRYPEVEPTKAEIAVLRRGRAAFRRGDSVSLATLLAGAETVTRRSSKKIAVVGIEKSGRRTRRTKD